MILQEKDKIRSDTSGLDPGSSEPALTFRLQASSVVGGDQSHLQASSGLQAIHILKPD